MPIRDADHVTQHTHLIASPSAHGTAHNTFSNRSTRLDNTFGGHHLRVLEPPQSNTPRIIHCAKITSV